MPKLNPNVHLFTKGNQFIFPRKINWTTFSTFNNLVNNSQANFTNELILDFTNVVSAYPNGMVPIIAVLETKFPESKVEIRFPNDSNVHNLFQKNGWYYYISPHNFPPESSSTYRYGLHRFSTDEELNNTVNYLLGWVLQTGKFAKGVPQAFEWMTNELAGNVLVHSKAKHGWVEVALYPDNKILSIVVCDTGIGIPNSMRQAFPDLRSDLDALEKAIQKEVTSKPDFGQGNGLSGSIALALEGKGHFLVASGHAKLKVDGTDDKVRPRKEPFSFPGTLIDLQIKIDNEISLSQALWGHQPISYFETHFEDDRGNLEFRLRDYASSFGNRITGSRLRTFVENLLQNYPDGSITIDFEGVSVIASSFADELFGKIAVQIGIWQFGRRIKPKNINEVCYTIINRIVEQRIAYKYKNNIDEVSFGSDDPNA